MYYNPDFMKMVFRRAVCNFISNLSINFTWDYCLWSKHLIYCFNASAAWMVESIRTLFCWGRLKNPDQWRTLPLSTWTISSLFKHIWCRCSPHVFWGMCEQTVWRIKIPRGQNKLKFFVSVTRVIINPRLSILQESRTWPHWTAAGLLWYLAPQMLAAVPFWIRLVCSAHSTESQLDWDLDDVEAKSTPQTCYWGPQLLLNHACFVARRGHSSQGISF